MQLTMDSAVDVMQKRSAEVIAVNNCMSYSIVRVKAWLMSSQSFDTSSQLLLRLLSCPWPMQ